MSKEYTKRKVKLTVRLSENEQDRLKERMTAAGITNQEAFIRKMALDGIIVKLNMPELKEIISLLRYTGNNVNQIAKKLHETGRAYETDIADVKENQKRLIDLSNAILSKLAAR